MMKAAIERCHRQTSTMARRPIAHKRNVPSPTMTMADSPLTKIRRERSVDTLAMTARQLQIARHIVGGKTAREIAIDLALSRRTVESHIDALRNRLDCVNRCQLTAKLVRLGVAPDD